MKLLARLLLVLLVSLLVFSVAGVLATWAPDRPVESLKGRWAQAPSKFVTVQGLPVHVRDEGPRDDPHPLVLLHGTSASLHTWDGWAQALVPRRRVIRFDLPGFGLTGPRADNNYSMAAYVQFVLDTLDALGVQRAVLAGNSLGGEIAWSTAYAAPARVHQLVLVDSGGYAFVPTSIPLGFRLVRIPQLRPLLGLVLPRGLVQSSVKNVYGDPARVTPELVDRYYELTLRAGNRAALALRIDQLKVADRSHIQALRLPTLVLWGGQDRLIPPEHAKSFAQDIPGAQVQVFETLGHVPHEEDPASTVRVVQAFLK